MATEDCAPFDYVRFFKTQSRPGARFALHASGVAEAGLGDIDPAGDASVAIESSRTRPAMDLWRERIAARYGVPPGHAFPAFGTHGAIYLALLALHTRLPAGAAIAVEHPAYGVFETDAHLFGREVLRVQRRAQDRYAVDPDAVERAFVAGARVFCVTDLNNPTGVTLGAAALAALRELAHRHDAWILLDEVYRDMLPGPVATGYRAGERVICTSSLTKCYGLGGLRAGWVFADPQIVERIEQLADLAFGEPPPATLDLAARALARGDALLERGRAFATAGRAVMDEWMASTPDVSWVPPDAGISGLVRVGGLTDSIALAANLREELDVQVVPGAYFGAEGRVRVSYGLPPKDLAAALCVLGMGIPALR